MNYRQKYLSKQAFKGAINFIFKAIPAYLLSRVLRNKKNYNDIWLIGERPKEARDNGYHLFKYIKENQKGNRAYYLIDKNSDDFKKIKKYNDIIQFGSFKHYIYYFLATKQINTHGSGYGCMPDMWACRLLECIFKRKSKNVFLQHGVTKDFMPTLTKQKAKIDMFVCGAKPEYEFIKNTFGYDKSEVKYLGFARFDNLHNFKAKKQILYMPTWRTWLADMSRDEFKSTKYYENIQSFINNNKLKDILEKYNLKLIVCLHPITQKYCDLLNTTSNNILVASTQKYDIQDLLKESSLCITDYSSVAFDFAYMEKPVLYYQFDYNEYRSRHFQEGYFSYINDGFGTVVEKENELISEIEKNIKNDFIINNEMKKRISKFFILKDDKNCKRIYDEIYKL